MKGIPNKGLFFLQLFGWLIFCFIVYKVAVIPTLQVKEESNALKENIKEINDAEQTIQLLKNELLALSKLSNNEASDLSFQELLLDKVSSFSRKNSLVVQQFSEPIVVVEQGYEIQTLSFEIEGTFKNIQNLVYEMEQKYRVGKLVSLHYSMKKNITTKQKDLVANIYVQNIRKI